MFVYSESSCLHHDPCNGLGDLVRIKKHFRPKHRVCEKSEHFFSFCKLSGMERHRCKHCSRDFANGRALGGHMRSHMMNSYTSKKEEEQVHYDKFQSILSYSSSSSLSEDEEENPRKTPFLLDQESETESSRNSRRPKRVRTGGSLQVKESQSPLSSILDITTEEDVAYCLMMMSKDKWRKENDYSEDSGVAEVKRSKVRGKYRCETCNKSFRSYQALGGHRASHKKIRLNEEAPPVMSEKIHECPFCHRVFASGQALGGHKRSRLIGSSGNVGNSISPVKRFSTSGGNLDIDLNLPAPIDDCEISH